MKNTKGLLKEIKGWTFSILAAFFIAIIFNCKVLAKVQVQQSSMENTLFSNQQLIVDKLSYNFVEPKRGDIIIFLENGEKGTLIEDAVRTVDSMVSLVFNKDINIKNSLLVKRVIGIPGDEVDIKNGYVYINGEKLEETYVKGETFSGEFKLPIKVEQNKLFVLGDNRMASKDSRKFGLINYNQIEGKAVYRIYPLNKIGKIK